MKSDSVRRALAILEAVAQLGPGATARQVAELSGTPASTAYRLLNLLVADGYLVRIEDLSGFALGRRTRELAAASTAPESNEAVLTELRGRVRYGIHLAAFDGPDIRFVSRDPDHELPGEQTILSNPHASAVGKIALSFHRHQFDLTPLPRLTPRTITSLDALAVELSQVRHHDRATELDESRVGRSAVAVPVRGESGSVCGALTALGRSAGLRLDDQDLTDLLHTYATRLVITCTPGPAGAPERSADMHIDMRGGGRPLA
ncbi:IclR family transcriptional regulator [Streptomyces sp. NPDC006527]|uniref:IclR family transcriptional regulator n=1 Tax=Streptomyces sp. NPDC006527 TaxID=3364749 RepID=UPI0036BBC631